MIILAKLGNFLKLLLLYNNHMLLYKICFLERSKRRNFKMTNILNLSLLESPNLVSDKIYRMYTKQNISIVVRE